MPFFKKKEPEKTLSQEGFLKLRPVRNPYLKWEKSEVGETVIMLEPKKADQTKLLSKISSSPQEKRVSLNKIGTFVWERCDGRHTVEQIVEELSKEYKMMRQKAEITLATFFQQLSKKGFIGVLADEDREEESPAENEKRYL